MEEAAEKIYEEYGVNVLLVYYSCSNKYYILFSIHFLWDNNCIDRVVAVLLKLIF